jgi:hypothetical protein
MTFKSRVTHVTTVRAMKEHMTSHNRYELHAFKMVLRVDRAGATCCTSNAHDSTFSQRLALQATFGGLGLLVFSGSSEMLYKFA